MLGLDLETDCAAIVERLPFLEIARALFARRARLVVDAFGRTTTYGATI